jgi:hypothetical protein
MLASLDAPPRPQGPRALLPLDRLDFENEEDEMDYPNTKKKQLCKRYGETCDLRAQEEGAAHRARSGPDALPPMAIGLPAAMRAHLGRYRREERERHPERVEPREEIKRDGDWVRDADAEQHRESEVRHAQGQSVSRTTLAPRRP